jgi:hypothetical protein
MRRAVFPLLGFGCFLALLLVFYRPVLFEGAQFAAANASYFYPLDLHVQQEWGAGRSGPRSAWRPPGSLSRGSWR